MSMSQEEIESLMNGLDISEDESSEVSEPVGDEENSTEKMSENDIADLIAQTDIPVDTPSNIEPEALEDESIDDLIADLEKAEEDDSSAEDESIDDLIADLENNVSESIADESEKATEIEDEEELVLDDVGENSDINTSDLDNLLDNLDEDSTTEVDASDIDELLEGLENIKADETIDPIDDIELEELSAPIEVEESIKEEQIEEALSPVVEEEVSQMVTPVIEETVASQNEERVSSITHLDTANKINVVSQLGQVADDSEEKATKIFDALSFILDDNAEIRTTMKKMDTFLESQASMLESLSSKFPNIKEFSDNLATVNELKDEPRNILSKLAIRDEELFKTMELMQFHDINRQKIERVMAVILNLSKHLNEIFDDEGKHDSTPVSKTLPGDRSPDLVGNDDLESLIEEFGK